MWKKLIGPRLRAHLRPHVARMQMTWNRLRTRGDAPRVIVLSLGGDSGEPAELLARAAWRRGLEVHLFAATFPEHEARWGHVWHRVDCLGDLDKVLALARRIDPVGVLVENTNSLLTMQAHLAEALGLRSVGRAAAESSNHKRHFRRRLLAAGLPSPRVAWLTDSDVRDLRLPVVFKPATGSGSKGVRLIEHFSEFEAATAELAVLSGDPTVGQDAIVEEYIEGRQFDVEGLCQDGRFHVLSLVEECFVDALPHLVPSWYLFHPPIPTRLAQSIETAAVDCARAAGVENGAWHCELRVDSSERPIAVDFANRIGWNTLLEWSNGISFHDEYIACMLDPSYSPPSTRPNSLLRRYVGDPEEVRRYSWLVRSHPEAVVDARLKPGKLGGHWNYAARLTLRAPDFEQMRAMLREADVEPERWQTYYPEAVPHTEA